MFSSSQVLLPSLCLLSFSLPNSFLETSLLPPSLPFPPVLQYGCVAYVIKNTVLEERVSSLSGPQRVPPDRRKGMGTALCLHPADSLGPPGSSSNELHSSNEHMQQDARCNFTGVAVVGRLHVWEIAGAVVR